MSASVNLPLHHKVQKFSSATGSPGWSRKKGRKTVVVVVVVVISVLGECNMFYIIHSCVLIGLCFNIRSNSLFKTMNFDKQLAAVLQ